MQACSPGPKHVFLEFDNNESDDSCEVDDMQYASGDEAPRKNIESHLHPEAAYKNNHIRS